jgi:hypothetical protein
VKNCNGNKEMNKLTFSFLSALTLVAACSDDGIKIEKQGHFAVGGATFQRTGTLTGVEVSAEEFEKLTQIPIVIYFGDYIPEEPSQNLGDENWRVRLAMARKFVETINKHRGKATLVELPKLGVKGNTHFLMQDFNNDIIADLFDKWLKENHLK